MKAIILALFSIILIALLALYSIDDPIQERKHPAYCLNHFGIPFGFDYPWIAMMLGQSAWRCDDLMHQREA